MHAAVELCYVSTLKQKIVRQCVIRSVRAWEGNTEHLFA